MADINRERRASYIPWNSPGDVQAVSTTAKVFVIVVDHVVVLRRRGEERRSYILKEVRRVVARLAQEMQRPPHARKRTRKGCFLGLRGGHGYCVAQDTGARVGGCHLRRRGERVRGDVGVGGRRAAGNKMDRRVDTDFKMPPFALIRVVDFAQPHHDLDPVVDFDIVVRGIEMQALLEAGPTVRDLCHELELGGRRMLVALQFPQQ